ncbi:MAG TPA: alpha/beta hydrolase [Chromatiales bacterium]|nr:alpha/beta hydrolase [Chromatiales bacterium]
MSRSPLRESLMLKAPAGELEALLEEPREIRQRAVAVLCHPHPQFQGTMLNKVVHTLARVANDLGMPAVRFNFRGVGASDGQYAGGLGEAEDTIAVAEWAGQRYPDTVLWLGGFSFGAMVAARAALSLDPAQLVSIAPPAARMAGLLEGRQPACPWLIVQGDADEVVDCESVVSWVNQLEPGPELVVLPGVDHFFHGRLSLLRETLLSHLEPKLQ